MSGIFHLNDGEGRPVCNSYMAGPYELADWLEGDKTNCPNCLQLITMASTKLFQLKGIARDISNISKKISDNFDNLETEAIADIMKLKRKLETEERKFHPRSANEAYIMALLVGEEEYRKQKKDKILNKG